MKHAPAETEIIAPMAGLRVLVVDDSAACRAIEAAMARRLGAVAEVADSAAQAQAMIASGAYDLAILDIGLADADGRVLIATLREEEAAPAILCVSGLGGEGRAASALAAGAHGFQEKPFASVDAFRAACADALKASGRAAPIGAAVAVEEAISPAIVTHALADLSRARKRLMAAMASGDVSGVRRTAHFLSGVAGVLNDRALGESARAAQTAAGDLGGLRAIEGMLSRVADAASRLQGAPGDAA